MVAAKSLNATITLASETGFVDPTWASTGGPGGARLPALPGLPASVPKQTIAAGNQRNKRMHMYKQTCMDAQACGVGPRTKSRKEVECWKRRNREGNPKPRILPCRESSLRVVPAARVQLAWTGLGFMGFGGSLTPAPPTPGPSPGSLGSSLATATHFFRVCHVLSFENRFRSVRPRPKGSGFLG